MKTLITTAAATLMLSGSAYSAEPASWTSVPEASAIAFGSVKDETLGEVHHFTGVAGKVSETGNVTVEIDLTSVETNIDIRNERMGEHVFKGIATATLEGEVDMDTVNALAVGETALTEFDGTLTLLGVEAGVYTNMLVARLAEDRVLVTTADFVMLSTEDLGIEAGVDKLMELASLPSITRVTPVSIRMVFEQ